MLTAIPLGEIAKIVVEVPNPRFAVLDIVVVNQPQSSEHRRRGVVTQVRRYRDGAHKYSLGSMTDGKMGGLYAEDWIESTGGRAALSEFASPGSLKVRDVVRMGPSAPRGIRGKTGHITAWWLSGGDLIYGVYVDELGED